MKPKTKSERAGFDEDSVGTGTSEDIGNDGKLGHHIYASVSGEMGGCADFTGEGAGLDEEVVGGGASKYIDSDVKLGGHILGAGEME
jgi:hypothetical protein